MRCYQPILFVVLCLAGMGAVLHGQGVPGYTLQETVLVPVTGGAVSSQTTLLQGVTYKLRAVGTAQMRVPGFFGTYEVGDAEYAFDFSGFFGFLGQANDCWGWPEVDIGLAVNDTNNRGGKSPSWGPYNAAHVYIANFAGAGAPISLNYHNCNYAGSQGLLTVQILRPMQISLPGAPVYTDVSPGLQTFPQATEQSVSGRANALAVAADGMRLYAGTFAGVWRSDNGGLTWRQMTQPQPASGINAVAGALYVPDVYDIAVSPQNPDVVMIGVNSDSHTQAMNGIYRSEDGGNTWALVKEFACSSGGPVLQIVFAPDDPNLVYAAGDCAIGISQDGGKHWAEKTLPGSSNDPVWHVAVAPFEPPLYRNLAITGIDNGLLGVRRVYALGSNQLTYSTDGGQSWTVDAGLTQKIKVNVGGAAAWNSGNSSRVLAVEPGNNEHVILAVEGLSNGPSYYETPKCWSTPNNETIADGTICNATAARSCGEGSLWLGDFSAFDSSNPNQHAASWQQLPSPPTYYGVTSTSGNLYVDVKPQGNSYLLFFSDMSHMHVSEGLPTAGGWHRMDGLDASQTAPPNPPNPYCNTLFVHPDPHAVSLAPDFSTTLQGPPPATPAPYNQNKVAAPGSTGDIWMANDGGVYHGSGALPSWRPASGLSTLATINIAGVAMKGYAPALYFGTGDNQDFFSLDGGNSWKTPRDDCGDCDTWYADPAQPQQVMGFQPYETYGGFYVYSNNGRYPDAELKPTDGSTFAKWACPTTCNASSPYWIRGYRPMVMTLAGTSAPATGDYLVIGTRRNGSRVVFRKTNANPMNVPIDWENVINAVQYGPVLPACGNVNDCIDVVQSSGGHAAPVLFAGDPDGAGDSRQHFLTLWKFIPGTQAWQQIVPSPASTPAGKTAQNAHRFYVDPYNPNTIYLLDDTAMKRSDDGGATWQVDVSLDNAVTENQGYSYKGGYSVVKDMIFTRGEDNTRFAVGNAGVFFTLDGRNWRRLLSTSALPSHPVAAYFDNVSDSCDRALYVGFDGRGILRIDPIPSPGFWGIVDSQPCARGIVFGEKP